MAGFAASSFILGAALALMLPASAQAQDAAAGEKALTACGETMPDAILLDWNMPTMDGYDFLRALRKAPGGEKPKVLFCTTENDVGAIARALHAGADEYIMKPFDRDIVTAKLAQVGFHGEADAA